MKRIIFIAALAYMSLASGFLSEAQDLNDIEESIKAETKIQDYANSLEEIAKSLSASHSRESLEKVIRELAGQDLRFDTYFNAHMSELADNELVMETISTYRESRDAIDKEITDMTAHLDAEDTIARTEKILDNADSTYARYLKQATKYSLVKQSAKLLEKVKAKEKMDFAKIQASFSAAAAAADTYPEFQKDFETLEEQFATISANSELIQSMEFKPFLQRIKDYLMSFAAVAIVLMFINMVQSRISSIKKMKESMKKMKETMDMNDQDIPSI